MAADSTPRRMTWLTLTVIVLAMAIGPLNVIVSIDAQVLSLISMSETQAIHAVPQVRKSPGLEVVDPQGRTALIAAAELKRWKLVKTLVENRADVYANDPNGDTALHWAAAHGDGPTVDLLIKHQANGNVVNCKRHTPLHNIFASATVRDNTVERKAALNELLKISNVRAVDNLGNNIVHLALNNKHSIYLLEQLKNDDLEYLLFVKNQHNFTPMEVILQEAEDSHPIWYFWPQWVQTMFAKVGSPTLNAMFRFGLKPTAALYHLLDAHSNINIPHSKALIEKMLHLLPSDTAGKMLIERMDAGDRTTQKIAQILSSLCSSSTCTDLLNAQDLNGSDLMHLAAIQGDTQLIDWLLSVKVSAWPAISLAVLRDSKAAIVLFQRLHHLNMLQAMRDSNGDTVLIHATKSCNTHAVEELLNLQPNVEYFKETNAKGLNAYYYLGICAAAATGDKFKGLIARFAQIDSTPLCPAYEQLINANNLDAIRALNSVANKATLAGCWGSVVESAFSLVAGKNTQMADLLIAAGVSACTLQMIAAERGSVDVATYALGKSIPNTPCVLTEDMLNHLPLSQTTLRKCMGLAQITPPLIAGLRNSVAVNFYLKHSSPGHFAATLNAASCCDAVSLVRDLLKNVDNNHNSKFTTAQLGEVLSRDQSVVPIERRIVESPNRTLLNA